MRVACYNTVSKTKEAFMKYYFIVLLAVVGLAVNFCLTKLYQIRTGTGFRLSVLFNIITGAFTAFHLVFLADGAFAFAVLWRLRPHWL